MARISSRRSFVKQMSLLLAAAHADPWLRRLSAADAGSVTAETSAGKIRGLVARDIKIFRGVPYEAAFGIERHDHGGIIPPAPAPVNARAHLA